MGKRKRQVRFKDKLEEIEPVTIQSHHGDIVDNVNSDDEDDGLTSLLHDVSNDTNVTPFDLVQELKGGVQAEGSDDDEEKDHNIGEDSDDDMERIRTKNKRGSDEDETSEGEEEETETMGKRQRLEAATHADAVGMLGTYLKQGETPAQALRRLGEDATARMGVVRGCEGCGGVVTGVKKEEIMKRVDKWELWWGDDGMKQKQGSDVHGPFTVEQYLEWARARYFVQANVGWVRGVGGRQWWKASDVFS